MNVMIRVGAVYKPKGDGAGYFMVMAITDGLVVCSPLFWSGDRVVEFSHRLALFASLYETFDERRIDNMSPKIQARYDGEKLKRWRLIDENYKAHDVRGHGRRGRKKVNLLSRKRRSSCS